MMRRLGDPSASFADLCRSRQRALHVIESELAKSDPQLTALFATFTLLTRDEELPRTARVNADGARLPSATWRSWLWWCLLLVLAAIVRGLALVGACLRRWMAGRQRDSRDPVEQDGSGKPSKGAGPWI
jgi:hypothetical protein